MAIFQDTFIRADQTNWGTPSDASADWVRIGAAGSSIVSNVGVITGSSSEVRGNNHTLSQDSGIIITYTLKNWASTNDCYSTMIKANGGNRDGFGLEIGSGASNNLVIRDSTTYPLGQGSFTFTGGTDYLFEIDISATYAMDIYIWASGGSKPGSPNVSSSAGSRTGAGSKFQFLNGGGGGSGEVMRVTSLLIASSTATSSTSIPLLTLMGVGT